MYTLSAFEGKQFHFKQPQNKKKLQKYLEKQYFFFSVHSCSNVAHGDVVCGIRKLVIIPIPNSEMIRCNVLS